MLGTNGQQQNNETFLDDRKNGERPKGSVEAAKLRELLTFQNYSCALSGRELTPENAQADHIVPVSEGGENVMENIQIVTADINRAKNTMLQNEFIQMCADEARCSMEGQRRG